MPPFHSYTFRLSLVGNKIGVLVNLQSSSDSSKSELEELSKGIAMHIAASAPEYVSSEDIPAAARKKVSDEFTEKTKADGKPADMVAKIVEGQLNKYFAERCLVDQPFVKNPDQTVGEYVKEHAARLGENVVVRRFNRIALGEVA